MGITVGCQVLSRVVDSLFGDLKHKFVCNFMDDFVVYCSSYSEHVEHVREIFARLEKTGFTSSIWPSKKFRSWGTLCQGKELKFGGRELRQSGISLLPRP
jgi:hypothetical protein